MLTLILEKHISCTNICHSYIYGAIPFTTANHFRKHKRVFVYILFIQQAPPTKIHLISMIILYQCGFKCIRFHIWWDTFYNIPFKYKVQVQSSLYCFPYIDVQQISMVKYNKYMSTKECICLKKGKTDQTP